MALSPVARTAFYCCAVRAEDAERVSPVCGDGFAARFLDDEIREQLRPMVRISGASATNVARHRLIDDLLRDLLKSDAERRVILLGAGFDTRAFRLPGGRWFELDDPELVDFKNARLPAREAPNPLARIPVELANGSVDTQLAKLAGDDQAVVVMEGVSMYLTAPLLAATARAVRSRLPNALLICDLMTQGFMKRFSKELRKELSSRGVEQEASPEHTRLTIEAAGYRVRSHASIVGRAQQAGTIKVPRWLLATLLRELRDGYRVWTFEPVQM